MAGVGDYRGGGIAVCAVEPSDGCGQGTRRTASAQARNSGGTADGRGGIVGVVCVLPDAPACGCPAGCPCRRVLAGIARGRNAGGALEHRSFFGSSGRCRCGIGRVVCLLGKARGVGEGGGIFAVYGVGVLLLYPQWTASLPLLIAAYALLAYPFVAKDVLAAWDALPQGYGEAARTMGANRFQTTFYITAPLLKPAFRRGLTLAAATCVGEFAATLFLARPEWQTLTTLIYAYLGRAGADNYSRAMVLTAVLMLFATMVFLLLDGKDED